MSFFDEEVDFSGLPEGGSGGGSQSLLPPGEYLMKAVNYDDNYVSKAGNKTLAVEFAFVDHEDQRTVREWFSKSKDNQYGLSRLRDWLRASGALEDSAKGAEPHHVQKAMGRTFTVKIKHEVGQNGWTNIKCDRYLVKGTEAPQPSASSGGTTQQATATPSSDNLKKVEWN